MNAHRLGLRLASPRANVFSSLETKTTSLRAPVPAPSIMKHLLILLSLLALMSCTRAQRVECTGPANCFESAGRRICRCQSSIGIIDTVSAGKRDVEAATMAEEN
ncbi:Hypothetical predicted protein [Podarcis lilfordi]|uniref:Uncharacterized protein n=1 Tax=Podarcis lilfordi TaxID=74358 RepID=A0AA35PBK5_9SAUR|nr:Hypothetical predicted protein [Podarcis lilfordi]